MFSSSTFRFLVVLGGLLAVRLPLGACGPDFPNAYLTFDGNRLTTLPTLSFAAELDRLLPAGAAQAGAPAGPTELEEVQAALRCAGVSEEETKRLADTYDRLQPPAALPREFHLYAAGARAWHAEHRDEAVRHWRALLALPKTERLQRTTWATYMIARAEVRSQSRHAATSFQAVRRAAREGFADSEDLARASLGEEARLLLDDGDFAGALRLYLAQHAAGDPSALPSLQFTLRDLFRDDDKGEPAKAGPPRRALLAIARDAQLRGIVTAWFAARGGPHAPWSPQAAVHFQRWLAVLPEVDALPPAEADRWAWTAYQNGLWAEAATLAGKAPAAAPASEWVRAMLRLRDGDLDGAAGHLAGARRGFPSDPALADKWFKEDARFSYSQENPPASALAGVNGVLALQREQFAEALRLFLLAGHWTDAAYVAERVLTLGELADFVDAGSGDDGQLRYLLARRLVRAGQFDRARRYFPAKFQPEYDAYVADVRTGYRDDVPARQRAAALWRAAETARKHGMEIQGTELRPDYTIWGGNHEWPDLDEQRSRWMDWKHLSGIEVLRPTQAESLRRDQQLIPLQRFHYRQRAAELALLAASLLPDNDDETARILHTAGRWIARQHPEEAQYFYKLLVFRCPHTTLGRAAAAKRWFVGDDAVTPPAPAL